MRVNLISDLRNPPQWARPWDEHYGVLFERFEEADRLGIEGIFLEEHHFFEDGYSPQPFVMNAAIAARTRRIRLGTAVMIAPLRPAADIAEQAALVDVISNGRMMLGLGAGWRIPEFLSYEADHDGRFKTLYERVREVRRLWDEGVVTPGPIQERPPIWYGAMGPRGARRAGRIGEHLLWMDEASLAEYRLGLEEGGHDPDSARVGAPIHLVVVDDPERAWAAIKPHLRYHLESYARYAAETGQPEAPGSETAAPEWLDVTVDPEEVRSKGPIMQMPGFDVVTPEDAVARVKAWCEPLPALEGLFFDSIAGMPEEMVHRNIELLATKVAPELAKVGIDTSATTASAA
jgi:alkanesulfonate monooxygenase SsuD/methylene tetrahydromethanopterin reductase-like flavin-dependent oxidoreductase (luciferase family)